MDRYIRKPFAAFFSGFYFRSWIRLSFCTTLIYLPFLINFIWGNHDWEWIRKTTPLLSGVFEGRFSQFILPNILFSGRILPVFSLLTALSIFSAAAVMLLKLWQLPQKNRLFLLAGLFLTGSPYTISWLYFSFLTLSILSWIGAVTLAFILLENRPHSNFPKLSFLSAVLLFTLALGGYPPIINTIGVIFFTLLLTRLCLWKMTVRSAVKQIFPHIVALFLSTIAVLLIQYCLKRHHLQADTYNTAGISFSELPDKLLLCAQTAFRQFFTVKTFISDSCKYFGLLLFLMATVNLWHILPKQLSSVIFFILSVAGMLFSCTLTLLAAQNISYVLNEPRIDFFGLPFIYAFSAAVLLNSAEKLPCNLTVAVLCTLIISNANTLSLASKIWIQGFKTEMNFTERVLKRLENTDGFSPQKQYFFIQGGTLDFRSRYADSRQNTDSYTLTAPFIPWHLPSKAYLFYYPYNFIRADFDVYWSYVDTEKVPLTLGMVHYLQNDISVWPEQSALYINPETVILTVSRDGKSRAQNWIRKNYPQNR